MSRKTQSRAMLLLLPLLVAEIQAQPNQGIEWISRPLLDTQTGNTQSTQPDVSADGRYVVFQSPSKNLLLVPDSGTTLDIFLRDRETASTQLISQTTYGERDETQDSSNPRVCADGSLVTFESKAILDPLDTDNTSDIYLRHTGATPSTELISLGSDGKKIGGSHPAISANGQFIVFTSGTGVNQSIYLRDLLQKTTEIISRNDSGVAANDACDLPSISAGGRFVAFQCKATNLSSEPANTGVQQIYLRDREAGKTWLVSRNETSVSAGNANSLEASVSDLHKDQSIDVAFTSFASNLVVQDGNLKSDIFVRHLTLDGSGGTEIISFNPKGKPGNENSSHPSMSADGRFVAYQSLANDLAKEPKLGKISNNATDVFLWDRNTGKNRLLSLDAKKRSAIRINSSRQFFFADSNLPSLSADGQVIAFHSRAMNLVKASVPMAGDDVLAFIWQDETRRADLQLSWEETASEIKPDEEFTLHLTVKNLGPQEADATSLIVKLRGIEALALTPTQGNCETKTTCQLGRLQKDQTIPLSLQVKANRKGRVTITASVSGREKDPAVSNNQAMKSFKVN